MLELSLKPQNSTTWLYTTTANYTNFLSDGILFANLAGNTNITSTSASADALALAISAAPPIGNWQGYYQSGGVFASSSPVLAGDSRNDTGITGGYVGIRLCASLNPSAGGNSGLYQRIYGLQIGNQYTLSARIHVPAAVNANSTITIGDFTSTEFELFSGLSGGLNDYEVTFTATDTHGDVYINLYGEVEECFNIIEMKCTEHFSEVELSFSDFEDGSIVLDLYEDNIPLTLSVSSFTDATSNLQSYSKDFKLPSTKKNDKVFSYIYDLNTTIENDFSAFNPYIKTLATLKEDGVEIFSGDLSLTNISKNNEGIQYDVNLQSKIVGLSDALTGRILKDLDFAELDHSFDKDNIKDSWTTGVTLDNAITADSKAFSGSTTKTKVVKYPFVNWSGDITDINGDGNLLLERLEDAFRPFINVKYLLERIIEDAGFTFDSGFMDSDNFQKLYVDFNHGEKNGATPSAAVDGGGKFRVNYTPTGRFLTPNWTNFVFDNNSVIGNNLNPAMGEAYFDTTDDSFKPIVDGTTISFYGSIPCHNTSSVARGLSWRTVREKANGTIDILHTDGHTGIASSPFLDPSERYVVNLTNITLDLGDKIYFQGKTNTGLSNKIRQQSTDTDDIFDTYMYFKDISANTLAMTTLLNESRGETSQWDFLKSLMNMFNLIITQETGRANHLIIEPYDSVFSEIAIKNIIQDYNFNSGTIGEFLTYSAGILPTNVGNKLVITSDGTQTQTYSSAYSRYRNYIDGETYKIEIDVNNITNAGEFDYRLYKGSNYVSSKYNISTAGIHTTTFTFSKSANGGSDELRFRMQMRSGTSFAYAVTLNSVKVIGKFENTMIEKDWTDKVDKDTFAINIMQLDKEVNFRSLVDKDDYAHNVYTEAVSSSDDKPYNFGDYNHNSIESTGVDYTNLTNTSEIKNIIFASTIIKPINDYSPLSGFITPAIYKAKDDGLFQVFKNKARILYDNGVKTTSATYSSPNQNGVTGFSLENDYLLFSQFSEFDLNTGAPASSLDLNWTQCVNIVDNATINNLFNEYWSTYYDELYHPDTRIYRVNALLNHTDIVNFEFTNIIVIENSKFRVNNIGYNAQGLSKVELIKLN